MEECSTNRHSPNKFPWLAVGLVCSRGSEELLCVECTMQRPGQVEGVRGEVRQGMGVRHIETSGDR